ncbi:response regulator [Streptomyces sp. NPDC101213]|uniref:response regulator n=1 Tax=Streptomyces sp. NPDC101213 TaxID=3366130 RepID=UPI00381F6E3A
MSLRVLVVDGQDVVRAGFAAVIDAETDMTVVGEAGDGATAVRLAGELAPHVVVMDSRMRDPDGIAATRLITGRANAPRVLVLTGFDLDVHVFDALRAGASGFLLKDVSPAGLLHGIRVVAAGEGVLAPSATRRLIGHYASGAGTGPRSRSGPREPAGRERHLLTLIASGLDDAEIARHLGLTVGTVRSRIDALLGGLGLRDRVQATILAYDLGLARPNPPAFPA